MKLFEIIFETLEENSLKHDKHFEIDTEKCLVFVKFFVSVLSYLLQKETETKKIEFHLTIQ